MSPAGASVKVADILAKIPHVAVAAPVNVQVDSNLDTTYGIEFNSFNALLPSPSSPELLFRAPTTSLLTTTPRRIKRWGIR